MYCGYKDFFSYHNPAKKMAEIVKMIHKVWRKV